MSTAKQLAACKERITALERAVRDLQPYARYIASLPTIGIVERQTALMRCLSAEMLFPLGTVPMLPLAETPTMEAKPQ